MSKKTFRTPQQEKELEEKAYQELLRITGILKSAGVVLRCEGGNIDIARIGHWVWIEGEELKNRPDLRGILRVDYKYNSIRKAWGWSPYQYRGRKSPLSLDQLAVKHGYQLAGV